MIVFKDLGLEKNGILRLYINAPIYWWTEFDLMAVGHGVVNFDSQYNFIDKEFSINDFATDCLLPDFIYGYYQEDILGGLVVILNSIRMLYLETEDPKYINSLIQLIPQSYMRERVIHINRIFWEASVLPKYKEDITGLYKFSEEEI